MVVPYTAGAATARARFRASGSAYLGFALSERGLFAVAFLTELPPTDPADPRTDARADSGLGPFQLLQRCVDELEESGALPRHNKPYTDVAAWSAVHGLAVLINDGPLTQLPEPVRRDAVKRLLDLVENGL